MKCLRIFCMCCVISLTCCYPSFALEEVSSEDSSAEFVEDPEVEQLPGVYYLFEKVEDEEIEEIVIDEPTGFSVLSAGSRSVELVIGDESPADPLFYGSCWVTGYDSNLGTVTVYFPLTSKSDTWGVDRNGYLYNISSGSVSGYLAGVYNNSVSASGFSYPRYRESSGSSYTYVDLHLVPSDSNMEIMTDMEPSQNVDQILPFVYVSLLGVIIVCFMKRY